MNGNSHYYGDIVRKLFFLAAVIMLFSLPFFSTHIPVPIMISLVAILGLGAFAGLTNPLEEWVSVVNTIVAAGAFIVFEYYAVNVYREHLVTSALFWVNQSLALIFLVSFYYATKTLRAMEMRKR